MPLKYARYSLEIKEMKKPIPLLLYPPLIEAIFEVHWHLLHDKETGYYRDVSYPVMYGRMYERLKKDFPFMEDLPSQQLQPETSPYIVRHRMRKEKNGYPLIQVGPGIVTVNEAKGYSWESFQSNILKVINAIFDFYPEVEDPLRLIRCEIRFLNGVPIEPKNENPLAFLKEKLHTKIEMDSDFYLLNQINPQPHSVSLNLAYHLQKPMGHLALSVQLGQMNRVDAFIFQTLIQSTQETIPSSAKSFVLWLNESHDVAENNFMAFCKGPLMEKFCGL